MPHLKQPWPWNCQHHAVAMLCQDWTLLDDPHDESNHWLFERWLETKGIHLYALYVDESLTLQAEPSVWHKLFGLKKALENPNTRTHLLVGLAPAVTGFAVAHAVGVEIIINHEGTPSFIVHDSLQDDTRHYTFNAFLSSVYSSACSIKQLLNEETYQSFFLDRVPGPQHCSPEIQRAYLATNPLIAYDLSPAPAQPEAHH